MTRKTKIAQFLGKNLKDLKRMLEDHPLYGFATSSYNGGLL